MKQNIILSIDKEILRKSIILAAKKDMSISRMLGDILKEMTDKDDEYSADKRKALTNLKNGYHLGGKKTWTRVDLYER